MAFFPKILDRLDERGAGGEHGVGDDHDAAFQFRAGDVFEADLKAAVALVLAVGGYEAIVGLIEKVQQPLMHGEAGAENSGNDGLIPEDFDDGGAERSLDFLFYPGKRFADLVGGYFGYAHQVMAEAQTVFLYFFIADLADPVADD